MAAPSAQTLQRLADDTGHQPGTLVALVDRHAARDLFDARRFLSIDKIDWNRIKAAVLDTAPAFRTRIANMPMLAWKTRHVRRHRGLDA